MQQVGVDVYPTHAREAEVSDADVAVLVEEDIFGFKVAVSDAAFVAEVDAINELLEVFASVGLVDTAVFLEVMEELSAANEVHYNVQFALGR